MNTFNIGQANAANQVIGDRGVISTGGSPPSNHVGELAEAIRSERSMLVDPALVERALGQLRDQLGTESPDPAMVRPLLSLIISQAGAAPSVLAAATTLQRLGDE